MTRAALALVLAMILLGALALGLAALMAARRAQQLRDRVRAQAGPAAAALAPPELPSIRMRHAEPARWASGLCATLRFHRDIPQEHVIPWPVVLVVSLAVAGLAWLRADAMLGGLLATPAGLAAGVLTARAMFGWQHRRYCGALFRQIPEALGLMVRAIRAGLPLAEALRGIARDMPSPSREEFARVVGEMTIGRSVDQALMRLHERTGLTEYAFLAVTLGLQAQAGGSLAETLDNLADMVRKRVSLAKRAEALAGEAKMQAGLLVILPFIAALAMSFTQPFYVATFTEDPTGRSMLMFGLGSMLLGLLSIRYLIRKASED